MASCKVEAEVDDPEVVAVATQREVVEEEAGQKQEAVQMVGVLGEGNRREAMARN